MSLIFVPSLAQLGGELGEIQRLNAIIHMHFIRNSSSFFSTIKITVKCFPFSLVICRDESGRTFIIKDIEGWQASSCVKCHCRGGKMSCQKTLTVFFPYSSNRVYILTETCAQPSCNVLRFLKDKGEFCEGIN